MTALSETEVYKMMQWVDNISGLWRPKTQRALMVDKCDFWGYRIRKIKIKKRTERKKPGKTKYQQSFWWKILQIWTIYKNINMSCIIYKTLGQKYQYLIYTIYIYIYYIYIFLYPLKYIKAAAIGQSEELFSPILNCLNILQPYSEDTEIQLKKKKRREEKTTTKRIN